MKPSPYENNSYTSGPLPEEPRQPLPPAPVLPAGSGELALALILAICSILTANSLFFGGFHLGYALGAFAIMTVTAVYVWRKHRRMHWYPLVCLLAGLCITASFARSNDSFVKFCLLFLSLGSYFLGLSQTVWAERFPAGHLRSLRGAGRAMFTLPYPQITPALRGLFTKPAPDGPQRRKVGSVLFGLLLAVPALVVILPLLVRSDAAFEGLIGKSILLNFPELVITLFTGALLFLPVYTRPVTLPLDEGSQPASDHSGKFAPVTLNTFLGVVTFFYLLYLFSQLAYFFSAFSGILPAGFTRAEYARRGFFEMAILCGINLLIVVLSMWQVRKDRGIPKMTRILCLFILVFSLILVACSVSKMVLYIGAYGLTRLRVLTSLFMLCMTVSLICGIIWIFAPKFPYMQIIVLTALAVGCLTGWADVDTQVARYNVNAYLSGQLETVDVWHLTELSEGAIPQLARLLEAPDPEIQQSARNALASAIAEHYTIHLRSGSVTLEPQAEANWRAWTWTQAQALDTLESLAPELYEELNQYTN